MTFGFGFEQGLNQGPLVNIASVPLLPNDQVFPNSVFASFPTIRSLERTKVRITPADLEGKVPLQNHQSLADLKTKQSIQSNQKLDPSSK